MTALPPAANNPFTRTPEFADDRNALLRAYAVGDASIHDLRRSGFTRNTEILAGLADLGLKLPIAAMDGPNVETRRAGVARLEKILDGAP